jgi:hypothetical protein
VRKKKASTPKRKPAKVSSRSVSRKKQSVPARRKPTATESRQRSPAEQLAASLLGDEQQRFVVTVKTGREVRDFASEAKTEAAAISAALRFYKPAKVEIVGVREL